MYGLSPSADTYYLCDFDAKSYLDNEISIYIITEITQNKALKNLTTKVGVIFWSVDTYSDSQNGR